MITQTKPKVVTHDGCFHADDVVAVAILSIHYRDIDLHRTRDPAIIAAADIAVDVGGLFDPENGRFDHHQRDFAAKRVSSVGYASAGLLWSEYGVRCIAALHPHLGSAVVKSIADEIDTMFMQYVDMTDTGEARAARGSFGFSAFVGEMNPTWQEQAADADACDAAFVEAVVIAQRFIRRQIANDVAVIDAATLVRSGALTHNGQVLTLTHNVPWIDVVCMEMPNVQFVVFPAEGGWMLRTVPDRPGSFGSRRLLPKAWWGAPEVELASVCPDAVFCHRNGFIARAQSKRGAMQLVDLALA